jgi:hypothetical protein
VAEMNSKQHHDERNDIVHWGDFDDKIVTAANISG